MTALLRWLLLSATFTLVHGSLRVGSVAGALQPGVPLAAVLSLDNSRWGTRAGSVTTCC